MPFTKAYCQSLNDIKYVFLREENNPKGFPSGFQKRKFIGKNTERRNGMYRHTSGSQITINNNLCHESS